MPKRALVVAKWKEDVSWLHALPANFEVVVYQSTNSSAPHYVENVGNEAYKYLSYIVDFYHDLPETVTFVQAGRQDWHDPLPKDVSLRRFDAGAAAAHGGFAFLPGGSTCWSVEMRNTAAVEEEDDSTCINLNLAASDEMRVVEQLWKNVLQSELGNPPSSWRTACCAQFEVTRGAIHRHPLPFYMHLRDWVEDHDTDLFTSLVQQKSTTRKGSYDVLDGFLGIKNIPRAPAQAQPVGEKHSSTDHHDPLERDAGHVMEVIWPLIFTDPSGYGISPEWTAATLKP